MGLQNSEGLVSLDTRVEIPLGNKTKNKGRFARVWVMLDPNKPLLPSLMINGVEKKIEYEGLHLI